MKIIKSIFCVLMGTAIMLSPAPVSASSDADSSSDIASIDVLDDSWQPAYAKYNKPQNIQQAREVGKTYKSSIAGTVRGEGINERWYVKGRCKYTYYYEVDSEGKVLENDGKKIVEERTFKKVGESLYTDDLKLGLSLPVEQLRTLNTILGLAVQAAGVLGAPADGGSIIAPAFIALGQYLKNSEKLVEWGEALNEKEIDAKNVQIILEMLGCPDIKKIINQKLMDVRHALHIPQLLQGKTVRIEFENGKGITKLTPIGCQLSDEEKEYIIRGNYLLDKYILPVDHEVEVDEKWRVDAAVLGGLLDSRLRAKPQGAIVLGRDEDEDYKGKNAWILKLEQGKANLVAPEDDGKTLCGNISNVTGKCIMLESTSTIVEARLSGNAEYDKIDDKHLLYNTRFKTKPEFEIHYTCKVEDTKK